MTCLLYLDGQLDQERGRELQAHARSCAACRTLLAALEDESSLLRGALTEENEPVPARLLSPQAQDVVPWGWIAGLGFAGAGLYSAWMGIFEPMVQNLNMAGFDETTGASMLFFGGVFWKGWDSLMTLVNIAAVATLGGLLFYLWRRSRLRTPSLAVVFSALLWLLVLPAPAGAIEIKKAEAYTLPSGETVKGDLIFLGGSVRIDGTVDGDLIVFCADLTVNGHVTGDVISFSKTGRIEGQVDGDIRTFGNTIIVNGNVAKSATLFTETLNVDSKAQIGGTLMSFSQSLDLDGRVARDVLAFMQRAQLGGVIGGSATLKGDRLAISSAAEIAGPVEFEGNREPNVSPQAKLAAGPVKFKKIERKPQYSQPGFYWRKTLSWGAGLMFGVLMLLLMPDFMRESQRDAGRYGPSFGAGLVTLVATPIVACIICFTVVGIGIAVGSLLLYVVALYAAQVPVSLWLGERMLGRGDSMMARIGRLALGLLVVRIAWNLPMISFFVGLIVLCWGLGALVLAIARRIRPEPVYAPSQPAPTPLPAGA